MARERLTYDTPEVQEILDAVSGKENASNKVTAISASSTDEQYPSAKCVYDKIAGAVYLGGVVETI